MRLGAIDIGTNSVRLLVADVTGSGGDASLTTLDRRMRITRLGQGVDAARRLSPEAIERTVAVLREYGEAIKELGVEKVRATATSAARDAANRDAFFDAAPKALGVRPELLAGEEEARLSFLGATAGLTEPSPFLVVDIGGGSTEFVLGHVGAGGGVLRRHRLRAGHGAVPAVGSACAGGALGRGVGRA